MSNTGIILRMWHNNTEDMNWRFYYFASTVLPRLKAQSVQDFDICILSPFEYHGDLMCLDDRIRPFTLNEPYDYTIHSNFTYEQTEGLKKYHTQIRMDSDDLVGPDFVKKCVESNSTLVSFQPELFILSRLKTKPMRHRYNENKPSAFMAYRGDKFIYEQVFFRFGQYDCIFYPEGTVWVSIHDRNFGTTENS